LRAKGIGELWDYLFIPKSDLEKLPEAKLPEGITSQTVANYPHHVQLRRFCEEWGKDPVRRVNVARLVSPLSVLKVKSAGDLRPGDMVSLRGRGGDHIGIIISSHEGRIKYADSIGKDLMGVRTYEIDIVDENAGIENQDWGRDQWYVDRYQFLSLLRLKVLDERAAS
jgi:hypothetical protein